MHVLFIALNLNLCHQEMSVMKQVVLGMSTRAHGSKKSSPRAKPKSASLHAHNKSFESYDEPNVSKPGSISLVSYIPCLWQLFISLRSHSHTLVCPFVGTRSMYCWLSLYLHFNSCINNSRLNDLYDRL